MTDRPDGPLLDLHLDFAKSGGLLPVVVQDDADGEVLMLGYVDPQAWALTLRTGTMHYWSRKKRRIWQKGEQSGHLQHVRSVRLDNDQDALLVRVHQVGGAVEDGYRSCFYYQRSGDGWRNVGERVFDPARVYPDYTELVRVAVPTGSLQRLCEQAIEASGPLQPDVVDAALPGDPAAGCELVPVPARDVPAVVADGTVDVGLTGRDMVAESGVDVTDVTDLGFNKLGLGAVQWVVGVRADRDVAVRSVLDLADAVVETDIPHVVAGFFARRGVEVRVRRPDEGTQPADAVVRIVESGTSMRADGFEPRFPVFDSAVHVYANNESMGFGWKRRRIVALSTGLSKAAASLPANPKPLLVLPPS